MHASMYVHICTNQGLQEHRPIRMYTLPDVQIRIMIPKPPGSPYQMYAGIY